MGLFLVMTGQIDILWQVDLKRMSELCRMVLF